MKKLFFIALFGVLFMSCATFAERQITKMQENAAVIEARVIEGGLVITDETISANIMVNFPSGYFYEDVVIRLTPLLIFSGGQIEGEPKYVEGKYVKGDSQVIDWNTGGNYVQRVEFSVQESMEDVVLGLKTEILATCYDSTLDFRQLTEPIILAKATM